MRGRRALLATLALVAVGAALVAVRPFVHGLSLVIRAADVQGTARRLADLDAERIVERELQIPTQPGELRARVYEPARPYERTALVVSGLHPAGIDEPRLVALAQKLAASGIAVVTLDLPDLSQFAITPATTDGIEQAATWLAADRTFAPDGRIGMIGTSFSGGLSIVAAGRPALRDHVAYVASLGGHGDLPRVLKYLCTGVEPPPADDLRGVRLRSDAARSGQRSDPTRAPPPHDYGVAIILLGIADRIVPREQVAPLRDAVLRFLWASYLDRVDKPHAEREFAALRDLARTLPEPSSRLLGYVNDRDVAHLGARLLPYLGSYGDAPELSPSRSPRPSAPVFLLHGIDDNVIPAFESVHLTNDLRGHAPVRLLLSGLISHAEVERPARVGDILRLAAFWGDLLSR